MSAFYNHLGYCWARFSYSQAPLVAVRAQDCRPSQHLAQSLEATKGIRSRNEGADTAEWAGRVRHPEGIRPADVMLSRLSLPTRSLCAKRPMAVVLETEPAESLRLACILHTCLPACLPACLSTYLQYDLSGCVGWYAVGEWKCGPSLHRPYPTVAPVNVNPVDTRRLAVSALIGLLPTTCGVLTPFPKRPGPSFSIGHTTYGGTANQYGPVNSRILPLLQRSQPWLTWHWAAEF